MNCFCCPVYQTYLWSYHPITTYLFIFSSITTVGPGPWFDIQCYMYNSYHRYIQKAHKESRSTQ